MGKAIAHAHLTCGCVVKVYRGAVEAGTGYCPHHGWRDVDRYAVPLLTEKPSVQIVPMLF